MSLPTFTAGTKIKASEMNEAFATIFDMMYPVGSIYMSATLSTASAVNNALPGTWEAWGAGRVPVGVDTSDTDFDTVEETGGEKTHTLVANELPKIQGTLPHIWGGEEKLTGVFTFNHGGASKNEGARSSTVNDARYLMSFGNDQPHNNLQPYITCYMYKRVS